MLPKDWIFIIYFKPHKIYGIIINVFKVNAICLNLTRHAEIQRLSALYIGLIYLQSTVYHIVFRTVLWILFGEEDLLCLFLFECELYGQLDFH